MDAARPEPNESTGLLTNQTDVSSGSNDRNSPVPRQRLLQKQVLLLALLLASLRLHTVFFSIASYRAKVWNVCYRFDNELEHHPDDLRGGKSDDPLHCYLEDQIMQRVHNLLNWERGISFVVLLLAVVPYGKVADCRGKKRVLMLALVGQLLYCLWTIVMTSFPDIIPLKLVWVAPAFWLVGGGVSLSITLIYLLASESLHEEQRTQAYFCLHALPVVVEVCIFAFFTGFPGPSAYVLFSVSLAFLSGCFVVLNFVSESTIRDDSERPEDAESTAMRRHGSSAGPAFADQVSDLSRSLTFLRSNKVVFALAAFTLPAFWQTAWLFLPAYEIMIHSPRHGHISDIVVSLWCGHLFRVVFFALFVPLAIPFAQKRFGISQPALNIFIIRGSILTLAIAGAYVTVASDHATRIIAGIFLAMGSGLEVSLLSYIASLAEAGLRGRLYGVVQVAVTIGQLITWPISERASWGNYLRYNKWVELPFIVMSITCVCVLAIAVFSRFRFG